MTRLEQTTEATGTPQKADAVGSQVDLVLGPLPERTAFETWFLERYSYTPAVLTNPIWESEVSNAREAFEAGQAAGRESCAQYCHDQRMALRAVLTDEDNGTWHDGVADGWGLAAVALRKGPNVRANLDPTAEVKHD